MHSSMLCCFIYNTLTDISFAHIYICVYLDLSLQAWCCAMDRQRVAVAKITLEA